MLSSFPRLFVDEVTPIGNRSNRWMNLIDRIVMVESTRKQLVESPHPIWHRTRTMKASNLPHISCQLCWFDTWRNVMQRSDPTNLFDTWKRDAMVLLYHPTRLSDIILVLHTSINRAGVLQAKRVQKSVSAYVNVGTPRLENIDYWA